jgi:RNA polymerase sigma-70 factor (ECF subfamily)
LVVGVDDERADEELLVAGRRDAEAFGVFYRRRVDPVLAFFLRRTGDRELAADLTAETFAAALASLPRYRADRSAALAWLFTIAHHKMVDSIRRGQVEDRARRRLRLEPLVFSDEDIERVEQRAVAAAGDPALLALERLSAEQRLAVEGRVLEEAEYRDLARRLRCSEAVVRKRVSRGLAELRTRMKEA